MATKTSKESGRRHRLEVRVTEEQETLIRQAADLERETISAFVLATVTERARRVVKSHQSIALSNEAFDRFYAALDEPETTVPEMVALLQVDTASAVVSANDPRLERLGPEHLVGDFDSGQPDLDAWLKRHALAAQGMDSARTFVASRGPVVVGYFSLSMGSVHRTDAPVKLVRGMPNYPVGIVLIARLAVQRQEQRAGLGTRLLAEALRMAVLAGETVAARLVVVDAVGEDAAAFYRRYGFTSVLDHPLRLYRRMKDVRASLEAATSEET